MSSFPQHEENIKALQELGFDVEECFEDGEVAYESWDYDTQTYLLAEIIQDLKEYWQRKGD